MLVMMQEEWFAAQWQQEWYVNSQLLRGKCGHRTTVFTANTRLTQNLKPKNSLTQQLPELEVDFLTQFLSKKPTEIQPIQSSVSPHLADGDNANRHHDFTPAVCLDDKNNQAQDQWPFQEPIYWRYLPYIRPM